MKEVTEHGEVKRATRAKANDGFVVDHVIVEFEDGWVLYLSQADEAEAGAVRADWFDPDGEPQEIGGAA